MIFMKYKTIGTLISVSAILVFSVFLISAFLPAITGGIEIKDIGEPSMQSNGMAFKVEWSPEISSSLPYNMTLDASVCIGDDSAVTLASMKETFSTGTTKLNIKGEMSAVMLMLLVTGKDSESGIFVPLELKFQGSYPYSLFKIGLEAKTLVKITNAGSISTQWQKDHVTVDLTGIGGDLSGLTSFSGTIGTDITVKLTGAYNKASLEVKSSSGDLAESLTNALDSDGNLTINLSGGPIVLNSDEASELIEMVKKGANP